MEQVSSILSNILSVEEGTTQSHPQSKTLLNRSSIDESRKHYQRNHSEDPKILIFLHFGKQVIKNKIQLMAKTEKMILKLLEIRHQRKHYPTP